MGAPTKRSSNHTSGDPDILIYLEPDGRFNPSCESPCQEKRGWCDAQDFANKQARWAYECAKTAGIVGRGMPGEWDGE
eukprot:5045898-Amphidinium_carterae.1